MKQIIQELLRKLRAILFSIFRKDNPNLSYIIVGIFSLIIAIAGMNIFIELTEHLKTEVLASYDKQISEYVVSFRTPWLTDYFTFVTHAADKYGYLIVLILFAIITYLAFKKWRYVLQITGVLVLSAVSNLLLKKVYK